MLRYTVKEVAEIYRVSENTVLTWIARGDLEPVDISRGQNLRPKWRITEKALEKFEMLRTPTNDADTPTPKRRRRRPAVPEVY